MRIVLIIIIAILIYANYELNKKLEESKKRHFKEYSQKIELKARLDRINFKSKKAYREDIWKSHKALAEIEKMSDYKNKVLDSDNQSKI